jgi:hypothetical protein
MTEQTISKQVAREYYNVIYGAKLNFASLDICNKLPGVISFLSMSIGILGLSFQNFNNKALASALLIAGIISLLLKPRELSKEKYNTCGKSLTAISKQLEILHGDTISNQGNATEQRAQLTILQTKHNEVDLPTPVFLSSWYAHYKLFSEQNSKWFCDELTLTFWKDKLPLSLRASVIVAIFGFIVYLNPLCAFSDSWAWINSSCPQSCLLHEKEITKTEVAD